MPLIIYFRQPNVSIVVDGTLDASTVKRLKSQLGNFLEFKSVEGSNRIVIPTSNETNILYVSSMTDEEFQKLKEQREAQRARAPIIERPQMIIPTNKKRH